MIFGLRKQFYAVAAIVVMSGVSHADSSSPLLAAYYDRQMAIVDGVAHAWEDDRDPVVLHDNAKQVGVGRRAFYVLSTAGVLSGYRRIDASPTFVMSDVAGFSAGRTGVLVIRRDRSLWWHENGDSGLKIAGDAVDAAVGDGANYYVTSAGHLFVRGRAHRGQYGDGKLTETKEFVRTATGVERVYAHTGHALYLAKNGDVMGTGGNIYGPVGRHGLGDKAIRWSPLVSGAVGVATGSSHSHAILKDGTLLAWGADYGADPVPVMTGVTAVAAGSAATIALKTDGSLWQWDRGRKPRRVMPRRTGKGTP